MKSKLERTGNVLKAISLVLDIFKNSITFGEIYRRNEESFFRKQ